MVAFYGDYDLTETVNIPFNTFSSDDPSASVTVTDLVAGDVYVHQDGVEGTPTGITVSLNVGAVNGNHLAILDLSNTNDPGFYAVGSRYQVRVEGVTIDGATVNAWIGAFSIGCTLRPATAGRTLVVESDGVAHADVKEWLGVAPLALSSQQVQSVVPASQKVDLNTIKTQAVTCGAAVTVGVYVGSTAAAAIASDVTTAHSTTDGLIGTAQADLDIITGATGVNLLTATQASIDAIETDTGTTLQNMLNTINDFIDTEVNAIKIVTDNLPDSGALTTIAADAARLTAARAAVLTDWINGGRLDLLLDAASAPTVEQVRAEMDSNSTQLAAIVADTNELQADWANAGRLDTILDGIAGGGNTYDITTKGEDIETEVG